MALVTVTETGTEVLICLHLPLSETFPERPRFVNLLRALLMALPGQDSRQLQPGLSGVQGRAPRRSPSPGNGPPELSKLLKALSPRGRTSVLGRAIATASGNLADIFGVEEATISEFLASAGERDVGEVHAQLVAPLVGLPGTGPLGTVVLDDARRAAQRGEPEVIERIRRRVLSPFTFGVVPGQAAFLPVQVRAQKKLAKELVDLEVKAEKVRTLTIEGK